MAPKAPNRYGTRFGDYGFEVFRGEEGPLVGVYEVWVPNRCWRYLQPEQLCRCGSNEIAMFLDTKGPFEVRAKPVEPLFGGYIWRNVTSEPWAVITEDEEPRS